MKILFIISNFPHQKNPVSGIFYKRMNKEGAISGMITGLLLMLFYMTKFKFGWFGGGTEADWWFGISP